MKKIVLILLIVFAFTVSGCSDNASKLFETAKFEELQNNKEHAVQLYEEIVKKYPDSEHAKKAKNRLSELKSSSQK